MIKVMLVDDEPLILEGLHKIIDWEAHGFKIVASAKNGKEALACMETIKVALVITDINMPECDGLELIENMPYKPKVIVLSGYQEFAYIQKGLRLGIENYLLKPIDEEELLASLLAVKEKISKQFIETQSDSIMRDHSFGRWVTGQMKLEEFKQRMQFYPHIDMRLGNRMGLLRVDWEAVETLSPIKVQHLLEKKLGIQVVSLHTGHLLIWWSVRDETAWEDALSHFNQVVQKFLADAKCVMVYSNPLTSFENIKEVFRELEMACELKLLLPERDYDVAAHIYFSNEKDLKQTKQIIHQDMIEKLANGEFEVVEEGLSKIFKDYAKDNNFFMIKSLLLELCFHMKNNFYSHFDYEYYVTMLHKVLHLASYDEAMGHLKTCFESISNESDERFQTYSSVIQSVVKYIHQNYAEDMSLKTLGGQFYLNPIYLGQLFQKEVKCSFTRYLNKVRIEHAKVLLLNSHDKAGRIGLKVGYTDPAYFYKQFKKYEKVTPLEWRRIKKNHG